MKTGYILTIALFALTLLTVGCGDDETTCADLDCSSEGRTCVEDGDDAHCGDCLDGYEEDGDICTAPTCESDDDCPDDELEEWGECDYESECAETGERTREALIWSCGIDEMCSAREETEVDTEGCERETEGDPCLNGSCVDGECQLHTAPEVTTLEPTDVNAYSATFHGQLDDTGGEELTELQFCWGSSSADLDECVDVDVLDEPGEFSASVDDLTPDQTHYVEARAANEVDDSAGDTLSFETLSLCDGHYVITDDFSHFDSEFADENCPDDSHRDCYGACPDGECVEFTPYPESGCEHISGYLFITGNEDMETLPSFDDVIAVDETIWIHENPVLETIDDFDSLVEVGGAVSITDNDEVQTLEGFSQLQIVGGDLNVQDAGDLEFIDAFQEVTKVGEDLRFWSVGELERLPPFEDLQQVGGSLSLSSVRSLTSIEELENVEELDELFLAASHSLVDLQGLDSLTTFHSNFTILNQDSLESLHGLESLTTVEGNFWLTGTDALGSLEGLEALEYIGGDEFWVNNNDVLPQCEVEELLDSIELAGDDISISGNDEDADCD